MAAFTGPVCVDQLRMDDPRRRLITAGGALGRTAPSGRHGDSFLPNSQRGQSMRTTFVGNSPREREPFRIALFHRRQRLAGHPGEGLNFSFHVARQPREKKIAVRVDNLLRRVNFLHSEFESARVHAFWLLDVIAGTPLAADFPA